MKKIINLSFFFLIILSLGSCLKDKMYNDGIIGHKVDNQNLIEMARPNSANTNTKIALAIVNKDTSIRLIPVRLASGVAADRDITVTLDTSFTTDYIKENIAKNSSLRHFNSTIGSLESGLTVKIPKGSNEGYIIVKTNSSNYNPAYQYVLGYSIKSLDASNYQISGLLNSHVFLFSAKNKYDGHYSLNVTTIGWAAYGISDNLPSDWPKGIDLVTTGANTNSIYGPYLKSVLQPALTTDNANYTQFGNSSPIFTFDPTTNKLVDVTNNINDSPRGRNFAINPAALATENYWNPATKSITANYLLKQPGRPDQVIKMVMVYEGSR